MLIFYIHCSSKVYLASMALSINFLKMFAVFTYHWFASPNAVTVHHAVKSVSPDTKSCTMIATYSSL